MSNQAVFSTLLKMQGKNLNILRTKRAFKMKEKAFFIILKVLSLKQIKHTFLEGESPTLKRITEVNFWKNRGKVYHIREIALLYWSKTTKPFQ